jgi:hypothetical protein
MSDAKWIGRVPPGHVNSFDGPLSLGLQRKKNYVALSTAEAKYVTAGSCCAQLLWMRQTLKDYDYTMNHIPLLYGNESVIKIAYNPCEYSRTKHRHPTPLLERSCHQRGYCHFTC